MKLKWILFIFVLFVVTSCQSNVKDAKEKIRVYELENYTKQLEEKLSATQKEINVLSNQLAKKEIYTNTVTNTLTNYETNVITNSEDYILRQKLDKLTKENNELVDLIQRLRKASAEEREYLLRRAYRGDEIYREISELLRDEINSGDIVLDNVDKIITINIKDKVFFDSGSADLKPSSYQVLNKLGGVFKKLKGKMIRVEGHTDNVPIGPALRKTFKSNWELAAFRALNVVHYFQDVVKLDPSMLSAVSYSKYRPIAPNNTEEGRAKNRRIQIAIVNKELYQLKESELNESEDVEQ